MASTFLWMSARSDDRFLRDHEYISRRLQWQLEPQDSSQAQLQRFYERLSFEPGPNVVIWDNVDNPSDLIRFAGCLPSTESTYILITSRNMGFSQTFAKNSGCIHLPRFSTSESVALLNSIIETDMAPDILRTLTEDQLGGLPLAIVQAGTYMLHQHISPLEYQFIFDKARKEISDVNGYSPIMKTVLPILDILEYEHLSASRILSFMSILDESHIPKYLLLNGPPDSTSKISREDLDRSVIHLQSYSLVHLTQDQSYLNLHRLVRDSIRRRLYRKGDLTAWQNAALKAVSYEFPQGDFENWDKCGELLPHALVVLECDVTRDDENFLHYFELLRKAGIYTMQTGRYTIAEKLLKEAYLVSMKRVGLHSTHSLSVATLLAQLFLYIGRLNEAVELEEQVFNMRTELSGPENPDTLESMSNLASIYLSQGQLEKSKELLLQTLERKKRILGKEHPDTLSSMSKLASIYLPQGRLEESKELLLQTLDTKKRILGKEHPDTLSSMNILAEVLSSQGRNVEAEHMLRETLALREMVLGREHPSTLATMNSLAEVLLSCQDRNEEAERILRETLALREMVLGREHPSTLATRTFLTGAETTRET